MLDDRDLTCATAPAVLRGSERTRFLSANDDEVGESIARCASRASKNLLCERRYRALAVLRGSERTRFLSANDDEVGESIARCASRASKNIVKNETATIRGRGVVV
jgi:hypothetical protein